MSVSRSRLRFPWWPSNVQHGRTPLSGSITKDVNGAVQNVFPGGCIIRALFVSDNRNSAGTMGKLIEWHFTDELHVLLPCFAWDRALGDDVDRETLLGLQVWPGLLP